MKSSSATLPVDPAATARRPRRRSWQRLHGRAALILMAAFLPLADSMGSLSISTQVQLVLVPIALFGIVHGGADPWVGRELARRLTGSSARPAFYSIYLSLMMIVLVFAWALPLPTLIAFLLISIIHFGAQDAVTFGVPRRSLDLCVLGAVPVLGPIVGSPDAVGVLFAWLSSVDSPSLESALRSLRGPLTCLWLIGVGMVVSRVAIEQGAAHARRLALAIAVLLIVAVRLPPLIAFALYFCLLHSFGHLLEMATARSGPWRRWSLRQWSVRLWPATLGAIALGLIGAWGLNTFGPSSPAPGADAIRVLFWGLAALTVPHVLLHAAWSRVPAGTRD